MGQKWEINLSKTKNANILFILDSYLYFAKIFTLFDEIKCFFVGCVAPRSAGPRRLLARKMMDAGESNANLICCFREVTEIQALVQLRCQHNSRKGVIQTLAQFSHREPRLTMQHFPIFVVLHVVPPLIIGDALALAAIKGRPLVTLDCEDESLNRFLVATARAYVVPVNLPDNRALLGFYLGAIIDHAPVIIGVSTSGLAPVLGQALRSRLETMLPRNYGRLAHFWQICVAGYPH